MKFVQDVMQEVKKTFSLKTNKYWWNWVAICILLFVFMASSNPDLFWNTPLDQTSKVEYNAK